MKTRKIAIALINSSIELKKQNGQMGFNFYEWLIQVKKDFHPELSLIEIWQKITFANCTENSCLTSIPLK